jgi:hypothetical protein
MNEKALKQSATNRMSDITLEEIAKLSELAGLSKQFGRGLNFEPKTSSNSVITKSQGEELQMSTTSSSTSLYQHFASRVLSPRIQSPEMEEV